MSKELEALRVLKANAILFDDGTDFGASMLEAISELDKYLTPPTADEVCKALSDYFGFDYYYYQDGYFYKSDGIKYIYPIKVNGFIEIQMYDGHLPLHLITLISRFYEKMGGKINE